MESDGYKYLNLNRDKSYTGSNKRLQKIERCVSAVWGKKYPVPP